MNDRELLEFAAKAAGLHVKGWVGSRMVFFNPTTGSAEEHWNPLTDDGDALRLAVKLELQLRLLHSENEVSVYGAPSGRIDESVFSDPCAATRCAIVRAAAQIGQSM